MLQGITHPQWREIPQRDRAERKIIRPCITLESHILHTKLAQVASFPGLPLPTSNNWRHVFILSCLLHYTEKWERKAWGELWSGTPRDRKVVGFTTDKCLKPHSIKAYVFLCSSHSQLMQLAYVFPAQYTQSPTVRKAP